MGVSIAGQIVAGYPDDAGDRREAYVGAHSVCKMYPPALVKYGDMAALSLAVMSADNANNR